MLGICDTTGAFAQVCAHCRDRWISSDAETATQQSPTSAKAERVSIASQRTESRTDDALSQTYRQSGRKCMITMAVTIVFNLPNVPVVAVRHDLRACDHARFTLDRIRSRGAASTVHGGLLRCDTVIPETDDLGMVKTPVWRNNAAFKCRETMAGPLRGIIRSAASSPG